MHLAAPLIALLTHALDARYAMEYAGNAPLAIDVALKGDEVTAVSVSLVVEVDGTPVDLGVVNAGNAAAIPFFKVCMA